MTVLLLCLQVCFVCSFYIFTCHKVILKIRGRGSQRYSFLPSPPHSDYLVAGALVSTECLGCSLAPRHSSTVPLSPRPRPRALARAAMLWPRPHHSLEDHPR